MFTEAFDFSTTNHAALNASSTNFSLGFVLLKGVQDLFCESCLVCSVYIHSIDGLGAPGRIIENYNDTALADHQRLIDHLIWFSSQKGIKLTGPIESANPLKQLTIIAPYVSINNVTLKNIETLEILGAVIKPEQAQEDIWYDTTDDEVSGKVIIDNLGRADAPLFNVKVKGHHVILRNQIWAGVSHFIAVGHLDASSLDCIAGKETKFDGTSSDISGEIRTNGIVFKFTNSAMLRNTSVLLGDSVNLDVATLDSGGQILARDSIDITGHHLQFSSGNLLSNGTISVGHPTAYKVHINCTLYSQTKTDITAGNEIDFSEAAAAASDLIFIRSGGVVNHKGTVSTNTKLKIHAEKYIFEISDMSTPEFEVKASEVIIEKPIKIGRVQNLLRIEANALIANQRIDAGSANVEISTSYIKYTKIFCNQFFIETRGSFINDINNCRYLRDGYFAANGRMMDLTSCGNLKYDKSQIKAKFINITSSDHSYITGQITSEEAFFGQKAFIVYGDITNKVTEFQFSGPASEKCSEFLKTVKTKWQAASRPREVGYAYFGDASFLNELADNDCKNLLVLESGSNAGFGTIYTTPMDAFLVRSGIMRLIGGQVYSELFVNTISDYSISGMWNSDSKPYDWQCDYSAGTSMGAKVVSFCAFGPVASLFWDEDEETWCHGEANLYKQSHSSSSKNHGSVLIPGKFDLYTKYFYIDASYMHVNELNLIALPSNGSIQLIDAGVMSRSSHWEIKADAGAMAYNGGGATGCANIQKAFGLSDGTCENRGDEYVMTGIIETLSSTLQWNYGSGDFESLRVGDIYNISIIPPEPEDKPGRNFTKPPYNHTEPEDEKDVIPAPPTPSNKSWFYIENGHIMLDGIIIGTINSAISIDFSKLVFPCLDGFKIDPLFQDITKALIPFNLNSYTPEVIPANQLEELDPEQAAYINKMVKIFNVKAPGNFYHFDAWSKAVNDFFYKQSEFRFIQLLQEAATLDDMFQTWLDNALEDSKDLGTIPGKPYTNAQKAKLTRPHIWLIWDQNCKDAVCAKYEFYSAPRIVKEELKEALVDGCFTDVYINKGIIVNAGGHLKLRACQAASKALQPTQSSKELESLHKQLQENPVISIEYVESHLQLATQALKQEVSVFNAGAWVINLGRIEADGRMVIIAQEWIQSSGTIEGKDILGLVAPKINEMCHRNELGHIINCPTTIVTSKEGQTALLYRQAETLHQEGLIDKCISDGSCHIIEFSKNGTVWETVHSQYTKFEAGDKWFQVMQQFDESLHGKLATGKIISYSDGTFVVKGSKLIAAEGGAVGGKNGTNISAVVSEGTFEYHSVKVGTWATVETTARGSTHQISMPIFFSLSPFDHPFHVGVPSSSTVIIGIIAPGIVIYGSEGSELLPVEIHSWQQIESTVSGFSFTKPPKPALEHIKVLRNIQGLEYNDFLGFATGMASDLGSVMGRVDAFSKSFKDFALAREAAVLTEMFSNILQAKVSFGEQITIVTEEGVSTVPNLLGGDGTGKVEFHIQGNYTIGHTEANAKKLGLFILGNLNLRGGYDKKKTSMEYESSSFDLSLSTSGLDVGAGHSEAWRDTETVQNKKTTLFGQEVTIIVGQDLNIEGALINGTKVDARALNTYVKNVIDTKKSKGGSVSRNVGVVFGFDGSVTPHASVGASGEEEDSGLVNFISGITGENVKLVTDHLKADLDQIVGSVQLHLDVKKREASNSPKSYINNKKWSAEASASLGKDKDGKTKIDTSFHGSMEREDMDGKTRTSFTLDIEAFKKVVNYIKEQFEQNTRDEKLGAEFDKQSSVSGGRGKPDDSTGYNEGSKEPHKKQQKMKPKASGHLSSTSITDEEFTPTSARMCFPDYDESTLGQFISVPNEAQKVFVEAWLGAHEAQYGELDSDDRALFKHGADLTLKIGSEALKQPTASAAQGVVWKNIKLVDNLMYGSMIGDDIGVIDMDVTAMIELWHNIQERSSDISDGARAGCGIGALGGACFGGIGSGPGCLIGAIGGGIIGYNKDKLIQKGAKAFKDHKIASNDEQALDWSSKLYSAVQFVGENLPSTGSVTKKASWVSKAVKFAKDKLQPKARTAEGASMPIPTGNKKDGHIGSSSLFTTSTKQPSKPSDSPFAKTKTPPSTVTKPAPAPTVATPLTKKTAASTSATAPQISIYKPRPDLEAKWSHLMDKEMKMAEKVGVGIDYNNPVLRDKFTEHRTDFGFTKQDNFNKANADKFIYAVRQHIADSDTQIIAGTYRGTQEVIHFYNPKTHINVMKSTKGEFISGWKLDTRPYKQEHWLKKTGNLQ